jgi:DNA-directed RNA polymerase subunit L
VEFCGYSIPHPSEAKMNIRIQSYGMSLFLPYPFVSREDIID